MLTILILCLAVIPAAIELAAHLGGERRPGVRRLHLPR